MDKSAEEINEAVEKCSTDKLNVTEVKFLDLILEIIVNISIKEYHEKKSESN